MFLRVVLVLAFLESAVLSQPSWTVAGSKPFPTGAAPFGIAAGDFNRDGLPDLATSNAGGMSASVLMNETTPGSTAPVFIPQPGIPISGSGQGVIIVDLNGDGNLDLAVNSANACGSTALFLNNTPQGAMTPIFGSQFPFSVESNPMAITSGDMNGDGIPDLVVANQNQVCGNNPSSVSVLINTTAPESSTPSFVKTDVPITIFPTAVSVGDLNADGTPDLVVGVRGADGSNASVQVFQNTTSVGSRTPTFSSSGSLSTGIGGGNAIIGVAIADINGDGKPDIVASNQNTNVVWVFLNETVPGSTTPVFDSGAPFSTGSSPASVTVGDMNGDGKPDLIVTNFADNTVSVFLNTTAPGQTTVTFAPRLDFVVGSGPMSAAVGDFNSDEDARSSVES
jgi:hypothetical protein